MYELHGDEFVLLEFEEYEWVNDCLGSHCEKNVMKLHNCTLHEAVGKFSKGDIVPYISITFDTYSHRRIRLTDEDKVVLSQHIWEGVILYEPDDDEEKRIIACGPDMRDSLVKNLWVWLEGTKVD